MTRICMICERSFGEQCPGCDAAPLLVTGSPRLCRCPACGYEFPPGEGGETHGLCSDECRDKAREEMMRTA